MPERVVVTGSTGLIGKRAVRALAKQGHDVVGVVRSPRGRGIVEAACGQAVEADVFDQASLARAFTGADVVVNLLTHIPPVERMLLPAAWETNERLRRETSAAVARAARAAGARRLVQESFAYLYADGGDRWLDEDAPLEPDGPPASALAAERNAREHFGEEATILRFAGFMGPDSDQTRGMLSQARRGISPGLSAKAAYVPMVWLDDAASAVAAAVEAPAGTYNVVDDEPVTRAELDAALAAAVGRERLRAPLAPVAKAVPLMRALSRSLRLSNRRLREASAWAPRVRAGTDGWALALEERVRA